MKSFFNIFIINFILFSNLSTAQAINEGLTLDYIVRQSDLVIEGKILTRVYFSYQGNTYTSVRVKVSKIFKGYISDSTVEIILHGGLYKGQLEVISNNITLSDGQEGILFLGINSSGAKPEETNASYLPLFGKRSFISYNFGAKKGDPYVAICMGIVYRDVEKDLFQVIEAATGQKRITIRKNMFGQ